MHSEHALRRGREVRSRVPALTTGKFERVDNCLAVPPIPCCVWRVVTSTWRGCRAACG
jgi:hypothetical protein